MRIRLDVRVVLAVTALLSAVPRPALPESPEPVAEGLSGLRQLHIRVECWTDIETIANACYEAREGAIQRLSAAGLTVVSEKEWLSLPGMPSLVLTGHVSPLAQEHPEAERREIVSVSAEYYEMATLVRDPALTLGATTWKATTDTVVISPRDAQAVKDGLLKKIDAFVESWKKAIP
jgi:hypothetical protein